VIFGQSHDDFDITSFGQTKLCQSPRSASIYRFALHEVPVPR
jgi:hypothetical protein